MKAVRKAAQNVTRTRRISRRKESRLVHRFTGENGRIEVLKLTSDNRLLLTIDLGGSTGAKTREVSLTESFKWYHAMMDPLWWNDSEPGSAYSPWLELVYKELPRVETDASAEELVVRDWNDEKLCIRNDVLSLEKNGIRRVVSVHEAFKWFLPSIESFANGGDISGDPRGEFEFYAMLTNGIFVPMNAGELAAAMLCATANNNGDVAAWAKEWISSGMESDIDCYKASA